MGRRRLSRFALLALLAASACAGPSQAALDAQAAEASRIMSAAAVYMPPKGVDPCVGVTTRLSEGQYEQERAELATKITDEEVKTAIEAAGIQTCREVYQSGLADAGVAFEPLAYRVGYGIDPAGKVCAIVLTERPEPIDPSADGAIESAGECLKNVLFGASFPAGRVTDRERVVRIYTLGITQTSTAS